MHICVIGAGHIGQHVLTHLKRIRPADLLTAVDIDPDKVTALREQGISADSTCRDPDNVDVWMVCVSTGPGLSWLFQALDHIRPKPGALVSIESTLPVGTVARVAERFRSRGYMAGRDFYLTHVPHRVLFGVDEDPTATPRVIAGATEACLQAGIQFYTACHIPLFPVSQPEVAELAKLVENSARYMEIAFAEALKIGCDRAGIDFDELRLAVGTKGNVKLADVDYGIGGECLPKDLGFLQQWLSAPLLEAAANTDLAYRQHLLAVARGKGSALLAGLTYKPGVPVVEGSRGVELGRQLQQQGVKVFAQDPLLTEEQLEKLGFLPYRDGAAVDVVYWRGKWQERRGRP